MMGSTCSMQRSSREDAVDPNALHRRRSRSFIRRTALHGMESEAPTMDPTQSHSSVRHKVNTAISDRTIVSLYPVTDNFIIEPDGTKSPKSLAQLATDALCRSLVYLNGALPPGLPPDVVQDIVHSLQTHTAWNTTTLAALKHCELETLQLAKCRNFTDAWLQSLTTTTTTTITRMPPVGASREAYTAAYWMPPPAAVAAASAASSGKMAATPPAPSSCCNDSKECNTENMPENMEDEDHRMMMGSCNSSASTSFASAYDNHGDDNGDILLQEIDDDMDVAEFMSGSALVGDPMLLDDAAGNEPMVTTLTTTTTNTHLLRILDLSGSHQLTDHGLLQLTHLDLLEEARFDHCHGLTGKGLAVLAQSHHLHTLSLAHCRRLTDEACWQVQHLSHSLQYISLAGCRCLTDRSLAALADLYACQYLDVSQCDLMTDAGLEHLENLELLQEMNMAYCREMTDRGLDCFTDQPGRAKHLRVLRLGRCNVRKVGYLSRLEALEELDLNGCTHLVSHSLGQVLQRLPRLTMLNVSYCPGILRSGWQGKINTVKSLNLCYAAVIDTHLGKLTNLPSLLELNLDSCPIGDWSLGHLADNNVVPNLTSLDLADTNLTDAGMVHIAKLSKLTRLSLFYCNISNRGLRHISQLKELRVLNLDSRDISDDGLIHLRGLINLESLDIFSGRISDTGCAYLSQITSLVSLELCGGAVGDAGCVALSRLHRLQHLNLAQNENITNQGAAALGTGLLELRSLNLSNTSVNSGVLRYLSTLKQLQTLCLYGCKGMDNRVRLDWFKTRMVHLQCLRVNGAAPEEGMMLLESSEDSSDDEDEIDDDLDEDLEGAMWTGQKMRRHAHAGHDDDEEEDETFYSDHDAPTLPR